MIAEIIIILILLTLLCAVAFRYRNGFSASVPVDSVSKPHRSPNPERHHRKKEVAKPTEVTTGIVLTTAPKLNLKKRNKTAISANLDNTQVGRTKERADRSQLTTAKLPTEEIQATTANSAPLCDLANIEKRSSKLKRRDKSQIDKTKHDQPEKSQLLTAQLLSEADQVMTAKSMPFGDFEQSTNNGANSSSTSKRLDKSQVDATKVDRHEKSQLLTAQLVSEADHVMTAKSMPLDESGNWSNKETRSRNVETWQLETAKEVKTESSVVATALPYTESSQLATAKSLRTGNDQSQASQLITQHDPDNVKSSPISHMLDGVEASNEHIFDEHANKMEILQCPSLRITSERGNSQATPATDFTKALPAKQLGSLGFAPGSELTDRSLQSITEKGSVLHI